MEKETSNEIRVFTFCHKCGKICDHQKEKEETQKVVDELMEGKMDTTMYEEVVTEFSRRKQEEQRYNTQLIDELMEGKKDLNEERGL